MRGSRAMTQRPKAIPTGLARIAGGVAAMGVVFAAVPSGIVLAQEAAVGRPLVTVGVSSGLSLEDGGSGESEVGLDTRLSFGLSAATRAQRFAVTTTGLFDLSDPAAVDPFRPDAALSYGYETKDIVFDTDLLYSVREIDSTFPIGEFEGADLVSDTGSRTDAVLRLGLETGRTARFGTETEVELRDRSYTGTTNPDLTDLRSRSVASTLRFDLTRTFRLSVIGSRFESEEDDAERTERERSRLALGADLQLDRVWKLGAELGQSRFLTTQTPVPGGPRVENKESGLSFALSVERELRNGFVGLAAVRTFGETGYRDTVLLERGLELRNGANLQVGAGFIAFEDGKTRPLVQLSYGQPLRRGTFVASLSQEGDVTDDGSEIVRTRGEAALSLAAWRRSTVSVTGRVAAIDALSGTEVDTTLVEIGLGLTHELTRDWGLTAGVRHRIDYTDGTRDDSSNIVSLNLSRSFEFRP